MRPIEKKILLGLTASSILAFLLLPGSAIAASGCMEYEGTCTNLSISATPGTISPSGSVTIKVDIGPSWTANELWFVVVITPSGASYSCVLTTSLTPTCEGAFASPSGTGTGECDVPYGASGSLSTSTTGDGTWTTGSCTGSNPTWYKTTTDQTVSSLFSTCSSQNEPAESGSASNGDTSGAGTYTVAACWVTIPGDTLGGEELVYNTFTVSSPTTGTAICSPVTPPPSGTTSEDDCTGTVSSAGGLYATSPDTGIDVTITGATPGTSTTITTSDESASAVPSGFQLSSGVYYDVEVSPTSAGGDAMICFTSAGSATSVQYYNPTTGWSTWPATETTSPSPGVLCISGFAVSGLGGTLFGTGITTIRTTPQFPIASLGLLAVVGAILPFMLLLRSRVIKRTVIQ